jgi:LysM repeat protein
MKNIFCGWIFCLLFCVCAVFAAAQNPLTHTVGPKESLSSIGRLYNINGRDLANYNNLDYNKGLSIGQVLKIPSKNNTVPPANLPEKTTVETKPAVVKDKTIVSNTGTPIFHIVAKSETLYHISGLYNKVPVADIKKWNHLTKDAVTEGQRLIVGYTDTKEVTVPRVPEVVPIAKEKPVLIPGEKEVTPAAVKATDFNGGIFKSLFDEQVKGKLLINEKGGCGIFKSNSGWQDGKYYCLHNTAPAGTIIKITNSVTGKSAYVKVLDMIPDIKQNTGFMIRISNAAADILGMGDEKTDCTINYTK